MAQRHAQQDTSADSQHPTPPDHCWLLMCHEMRLLADVKPWTVSGSCDAQLLTRVKPSCLLAARIRRWWYGRIGTLAASWICSRSASVSAAKSAAFLLPQPASRNASVYMPRFMASRSACEAGGLPVCCSAGTSAGAFLPVLPLRLLKRMRRPVCREGKRHEPWTVPQPYDEVRGALMPWMLIRLPGTTTTQQRSWSSSVMLAHLCFGQGPF